MFVLKHWIFFEDIPNFNKWKSLIIDKTCWMLQNAMLSKENDNFAKKVISTENVAKQCGRSKKKKSNLFFFSKLLGDYNLGHNILELILTQIRLTTSKTKHDI